jgi:hypothetical protein
MRRFFLSFAPVVAAAALVLGGASSALAASPSSTSLDASFCYPSGASTFCYDIDGAIHYVDSAAGSAYTLEQRVRTTRFENGIAVGSAFSVQKSRGVFRTDGTVVIDTVTHTHSTLDGEPCSYRLVLRLVDYEAVVDHEVNGCL